MTSRFDHFKAIFQQPAERQQSASQREAERRQIKEDMAEGRRTAQKQAAAADPNAAYEAHCKAQALRIVQAGARARGIPVPTCLEQDRDDEEYPGDDTPVDDKDHKKSKKRAKPAKIIGDDQSDDDAKEKDEGETSDGNDEIEKEKRDKAAALLIINAGRRARNLPLLAKLDQD
jgi:hypothetical protein